MTARTKEERAEAARRGHEARRARKELHSQATAPKLLADQPAPLPPEGEYAAGSVPDTRVPVETAAPEGHVHLVHMLADGLTLGGVVRYSGEDYRVTPGTPEYDAVHVDGVCLLAMDDDAQWERFGKVMFAPGPWRGRGYDLQAKLDSGEELTVEERKVLDKINRARGLAAPAGSR